MRFKGITFRVVLFILVVLTQNLHAQTTEQKALEEKREQLQKEIRDINRLLFAEKKERGNVLDQMEALDKKITVRSFQQEIWEEKYKC